MVDGQIDRYISSTTKYLWALQPIFFLMFSNMLSLYKIAFYGRNYIAFNRELQLLGLCSVPKSMALCCVIAISPSQGWG